jgi:hypothetical protein
VVHRWGMMTTQKLPLTPALSPKGKGASPLSL